MKVGESPASSGTDLFPERTFEPVSDKSPDDEDDQEEKYLDEEAGRSHGSEVDARTPGNKVLLREYENNPEDKAGNDPVFQESVIVFLSLVEKAKGDAKNQVQYFKQHGMHSAKGSIAASLQKGFRNIPDTFSAVLFKKTPGITGAFCQYSAPWQLRQDPELFQRYQNLRKKMDCPFRP
jgi:hypothetical protein